MTFHREGQTIVIEDVPAEECQNCGEAYVADTVTEQLLAMTTEARKAHAHVLVRPFAPAA